MSQRSKCDRWNIKASRENKYKKISLWHWNSLVAQMVKRLPAMWETQVWSPGQEDPLEKEMTMHSSTLAWKIPWMEEPGKLQSLGSQRVRHDSETSFSFFHDTGLAFLCKKKGQRLRDSGTNFQLTLPCVCSREEYFKNSPYEPSIFQSPLS